MIVNEQLSERRACELVSLSRSQFRYTRSQRENGKLVKRIIQIKDELRYYGVPRVHAMLRREGFNVNRKRVYRLLKALDLLVGKRVRRTRLVSVPNCSLPQAVQVGDVWSMDFVFDRFSDGTKFRCFTMVDILSREVPGIFISRSMANFSPVNFLEELKLKTNLPKHFILDNGTEFKNQVFLSWCEANEISVHFIDPGKPVQNAYIESFNGKFRSEFLSQKSFGGISQIRADVKKWVQHYNEERPHSSLDYMTPKEFANNERNVLTPKINLPVLKTG